MPELPEVETVRNTLKNFILDKKIIDIKSNYENIIKELDFEEFKYKLLGKSIFDIKRLGKFLLFELEDLYLVSHLRMEGKYFIKDCNDEIIKHEHVVFYFEDGSTLRYHDTRKFGTMHLRNKEELYNIKPLSSLGYEPFNENLTIEYLNEKLMKTKRPIKTVLLDQSIITGLGNIYVDEVCFDMCVHPTKPACELSSEEISKIKNSSIKILNKAIELGGTTIKSYTSSLGVTGRFQNELMVHQRENEYCHICKEVIIKTKVGGRGTYYCPKCQNNY